MGPDTGSERQVDAAERSLQVEFEIDLLRPCPVAKMYGVREVHQRVADGVCRTDVIVADETGTGHVAHRTTSVGPDCTCKVFDDFDCVPQILSGGDDLRVRTFVDDRETLTALIAALKDVAGSVRLRRITETPTHDDGETVPVSLDALTETQRQTLETAVQSGYYASPRRASLDDLATEFGVSKSAVSRRLHAAENNLVGELFPCSG